MPPVHAPIPLSTERHIDRLAIKLAECRTDLTDDQRHTLARVLAYRCRTYRLEGPDR